MRCVQLPTDLAAWRFPGDAEQDEIIWRELYNFFKARGFTYWEMELPNLQVPPDGRVTSNGFGYASLRRGWGQGSSFEEMQHFMCPVSMPADPSLTCLLTVHHRLHCVGPLVPPTGATW